MPEPHDDLPASAQDPLVREREAVFPSQPDGAAPALDDGAGGGGEPAGGRARRPGALGRVVWWIGVIGSSVNLVLWALVLGGVVSHEYPYLPVAIAFIVPVWIGRGLMISARSRAGA